MEELEQKIRSLELEIGKLKKEGANLSEDSRKAIIHDTLEKVQDGRYKNLGLTMSLIAIILSSIAFFGYESIKSSTSEQLVRSEMKKQVLSDLTLEKKKFIESLSEAKLLLKTLDSEKKHLESQFNYFQSALEEKVESIEKASNLLAKLNLRNRDLKEAIPSELIDVIHDSEIFVFPEAFGLSITSVIKILATETEEFNFYNITQEEIESNIKQLQERYELTIDGNMGPCTSLVIGSLLMAHFEAETRDEVVMSSFHSKDWLVSSFQTCSAHDREQIQRYMDYPDLPLHVQLNNFIKTIGINRSHLLKALTNNNPMAQAYKALDFIGYEQVSQ